MALPASAIWEVRPTGSDSLNGGAYDPSVTSPGSDLSQQDAAAVSYSDLVIGATTTNLTSAAHPFGATHVGNTVQITGGTGFTTGFYSVRSVSGAVATMDRAVGTAASTGGVGGLGGALASPGKAAGACVGQNTIWVKAGTYSVTTTSTNVSAGPLTFSGKSGTGTAFTRLIGYDATRGDYDGTRPTISAGVSLGASYLVTGGANFLLLDNLILDCASQSGGFNGGGSTTAFSRRVKVMNNSQSGLLSVNGGILSCEVSGNSGAGFETSTACVNCYAHGGSGIGFKNCGAYGCLASGVTNAGGGFFWNSNTMLAVGCTAYNCAHGFDTQLAGALVNCLAYGNSGYGFNVEAAYAPVMLVNCAGGSNTSGNSRNLAAPEPENFITLTADPFVNAAGGNFGLNSVAGGGALCRAAGLGTFAGLSATVGYPDIGAVQSPAAGGLRRVTMTGGITG